MICWGETMQDDLFVIAADGWTAGREVYRIKKSTKDKNGTVKEKNIDGIDGIESKLLKPDLLVNRYFATEKAAIDGLGSPARRPDSVTRRRTGWGGWPAGRRQKRQTQGDSRQREGSAEED